MTKNQVIRKSEITQYTWCPYAYQLILKGVSASQTLQDLQKNRILSEKIVMELQQKHHIAPSTPVDKIIGQGLLSPKIEQKIIQQNIMLQGTAAHEQIGKTTQAGAMVQEHKGGYLIVLLIILIIIGFLVMILLQRGGI